MDTQTLEAFRERFRIWLGPDPEAGARVVAGELSYSVKYVRWVAGLVGAKPWPGSRRFVAQVATLGFSLTPWRDRSSEDLARAFQEREVLYSPGE